MGRTIKKQFWLNSKEAEALRRNAEKTCLTETALVPQLLPPLRRSPSLDEGGQRERGKIEPNPNHMPDMRRVRRAYDFFCFRRIGVGRPNWPNGGFSARMTRPRPIRRRTDCGIIGV